MQRNRLPTDAKLVIVHAKTNSVFLADFLKCGQQAERKGYRASSLNKDNRVAFEYHISNSDFAFCGSFHRKGIVKSLIFHMFGDRLNAVEEVQGGAVNLAKAARRRPDCRFGKTNLRNALSTSGVSEPTIKGSTSCSMSVQALSRRRINVNTPLCRLRFAFAYAALSTTTNPGSLCRKPLACATDRAHMAISPSIRSLTRLA